MRWLLVFLVACGPKVSTNPTPFDEDLPRERAALEPAEPASEIAPNASPVAGARSTPAGSAQFIDEPRPEAPPGKGLRSGTIERAKLNAVLDAGPGKFLRQFEITPRMKGNRFVGWELVQVLDRGGALVDVDVVPGDVLLAVNGKPIARPDQLQAMWDSLRTANEVRAQLWRGNAKLELAFVIEPKVDKIEKVEKPKVQLTK